MLLIPLLIAQHTEPLPHEKVFFTHVAHPEAALRAKVTAVEEPPQLCVAPCTHLGQVVSRSEHALHPDRLNLRLQLAVRGR